MGFMTDSASTDDVLPSAFADAAYGHIGSFRYLLDEDRWEWSDAVARMHGYEPGPITPDVDLLLEHKHPEDREHITALLVAVRKGDPFSSRHRIIDAQGNIKRVVVIGDRLLDDAGRSIGTAGFYLDLSEAIEEDVREAVDEAMSNLAEARAVIEQAKGVLMLAYSIPATRAFEILAWRSQEANVKLRVLAERLVDEVTTGSGIRLHDRVEFDHLLMTLHQRAR